MFEERPRVSAKYVPLVVGLVVLAIIVITVVGGVYVTIPAGYRGIVLTWAKPTGIFDEGLHFKIPIMQNVELMNVQIQKAESSEETASKDLQAVTTTVAVVYKLDPTKVLEIYRTLRQDYVDRVIKPNIEESLKATTADFAAEELITRRADLKTKLDDNLEVRLRDFGIELVSVAITDFQFSKSFNDAIEAKVTAEQSALEARNKLEQVRYEAQQQIIQAEAARNATITRATGEAEALIIAKRAEAEAILIEATATADAIQFITSQMNPNYAQYKWLEEWDGKLPLFLGGEGEGILIDLSSLREEQ
ncbi:MAG: prohibitin family protein [Candidatus Bathyarchaeota archaeon]|nr:prohibitin family protein [Candidatus Bathyarchaeota archaeon]